MTLVGCWLDRSFGQTKICALADSRASAKLADGKTSTHSDLTQKLFIVDVNSYALNSVVPGIGAAAPYHQMKIGVGFSGDCFEALTVIAYIMRSLGALVDVDGAMPRPEPEGIVELVKQIVSLYLTEHRYGSARDVHLLLFGFAEDVPWVATVRWVKASKLVRCELTDFVTKPLVAVGDGVSTSTFRAVRRLRKSISDQVAKVRRNDEASEMRRARLEVIESSAVVAAIKRVVDDEFVPTVAGALQKVELILAHGIVTAAYVKDPVEHMLNQLGSVSSLESTGAGSDRGTLGRRWHATIIATGPR